MYQLTFEQQSSSVLNHMQQQMQMKLIEFLSALNFDKIALDQMNKIIRGKDVFYRIHWEDFRVYLQVKKDNLLTINYILPKHTWNDFLFRTKLPFDKNTIENNKEFWEFLSTLK